MNAGLNEDQSELGIFILAVPFEVLADGNGLEGLERFVGLK